MLIGRRMDSLLMQVRLYVYQNLQDKIIHYFFPSESFRDPHKSYTLERIAQALYVHVPRIGPIKLQNINS